MIKGFAFLLEFLRFLVIFALGIFLLGELEQVLYRAAGIEMLGGLWWMPGLANVLLMLVCYHNRLQFTGWFRSAANRPISRRTTYLLVSMALLLLILPFIVY